MSSSATITDRSSGNNHRRRFPRQRVETLTYVGLGLENGGFPINVSEGGMAFQGIQPLEKDQLIHINFKLPGLSNSLESFAQIAWLNDHGKGGGLRFIDMPEDTQLLINEWLSLQTSSCSFTESAPILRSSIETKNFQSAPEIHSLADQDHSSTQADSRAVETLLDSSLSPVAATNAITTSDTVALPIHSSSSALDYVFRDPLLETGCRNAWGPSFSLALIALVAIAAILGVIIL
jgi:hypothetical protein